MHTKKIGHIAGANVKLAAETWYQKQIEKGLEIEEGKIEIRKEFVYQQGCSSKALVTHCMSPESEKIDVKITKMQMWTGKHTKHVSFKRTESKVKLGTLHFNNVKNIAGRCEFCLMSTHWIKLK